MKELSHIKKVEEEVALAVKKANEDAEERISQAKSECSHTTKKMIDKANKEMDTKIEMAKSDAENESEGINKSIPDDINKIEKESDKNLDKAVEVIVKEFYEIK